MYSHRETSLENAFPDLMRVPWALSPSNPNVDHSSAPPPPKKKSAKKAPSKKPRKNA